jgi:DNA replication protein DnaC
VINGVNDMPRIVWTEVKSILTAESGRDFERVALPFLRIEWPELAYPSDLGFLDCKGIDQAVVAPGRVFPVVIQFKGFEILGQLGQSQLNQVEKSIHAFLASGINCERYILLYNRDGYNQQFEQAAQVIVNQLVTQGKAQVAEIWNVDDAVKFLQSSLDKIVKRKMSEVSSKKAQLQQSHFLFGNVLIEDVPYRQATWSFGRTARTSLSAFETMPARSLRELLTALSPTVRWTLLIGAFGMGKSTFAVSLANEAGKIVIYVPATEMHHLNDGGGSETRLWRDIARYLNVFDDSMGVERIRPDLFLKLVSDSISRIMRSDNSDIILVIDGLDENRHYSKINGLKLLVNELAAARIPIVLTTRREHFFNAYGTYEGEFSNLSRAGSRKSVRVVELTDWSSELALAFLDKSARTLDSTTAARLQILRDKISSGSLTLIATHPLWLTMATELAVEDVNIDYEKLTELYEDWTLLKLKRDFEKPRAIPVGFEDNLDVLIAMQQLLMQKVAIAMTCEVDGTLVLTEFIDEASVHKLAKEVYEGRVPTEVYAVTSLLDPIGRRSASQPLSLKLRFFHASLHEFYVARELKSLASSAVAVPPAVERFMN